MPCDKVKQESDRMELIGVHCKVKEPTAWINSLQVVNKSGSVPACLDPRKMNIMRALSSANCGNGSSMYAWSSGI